MSNKALWLMCVLGIDMTMKADAQFLTKLNFNNQVFWF